MDDKLSHLVDILADMGTIGIGYSGGVDSTYLAAICAHHLPERAMLLHLDNPLATTPERAAFERDARSFGLPVVRIPFDALNVPEIAANPADRCYHCKHAGFAKLTDVARERGCDTVVDGSNADDAGDYRPGMRALVQLGVRSPLMEAGITKAEEREQLRAWGLDVWRLPAGACLATRIPCGVTLTARDLETVRACEDGLHDLGLAHVRVRLRDGAAQVSAAPEDLERLRSLGGTPEAAGVLLPDQIRRQLIERGAGAVDKLAVPYVHGALSAGDAGGVEQCPQPVKSA